MDEHLSWRHVLAFLVTASAAWLFWNGTHLVLTEPLRTAATHLIHVSLASPTTPPVPPKLQPRPPKPQPAKRPATARPVETSPNAVGPSVAPPSSAPSQNMSSQPSPPAPSAEQPRNTSLESAYEASVREAIEQEKRYPMSKDARLEQPRGKVVLWLTLDRSGQLLNVEIEESAGSILDRAAIETVHRTTYPPFPDAVWPGDSKSRLKASINFIPP